VRRSALLVLGASALGAALATSGCGASGAAGPPPMANDASIDADQQPDPREAGVPSSVEALPAVYAVVHAAPSLGDVRICFRDAVSGTDLYEKAWPTEGSVPRTNYPGLAAGRGTVLRDPAPLQGRMSVVADVYDAYAAGVNDRPEPVSCQQLRERSVQKKATLGPMTPLAGPALLALTECPTGGCPGGAPAELEIVSLSPTIPAYGNAVQAVVLTRALGSAPLSLSWGGTTIASDLVFAVPSMARTVTLPDGGVADAGVELVKPSARWDLVEVQDWSDPSTVPSSFYGVRGLFVLALVGSPSGTGVGKLHPVVVPIDVTKGG
jgi:hypothetical protein